MGDRTLYKGPADRIDPNTTLQNTLTTSEPKEEMIQTFQTDTSTEGILNEPDEPQRTTRIKSMTKYLKDYVTI